MKRGIRSLRHPHYLADSADMMTLLGLKPGGHLPLEGMPPRTIQGYTVWVNPWKPKIRVDRYTHKPFEKKSSTHRVMIRCHCGRTLSAGRMHQHKCK